MNKLTRWYGYDHDRNEYYNLLVWSQDVITVTERKGRVDITLRTGLTYTVESKTTNKQLSLDDVLIELGWTDAYGQPVSNDDTLKKRKTKI